MQQITFENDHCKSIAQRVLVVQANALSHDKQHGRIESESGNEMRYSLFFFTMQALVSP